MRVAACRGPSAERRERSLWNHVRPDHAPPDAILYKSFNTTLKYYPKQQKHSACARVTANNLLKDCANVSFSPHC